MRLLNLNLLLTILVLGLAVASCKKDKDNDDDGDGLEKIDTSTNHFSYKGKSYELSKGYLEFYGENDENSSDFDISLCSSEINYDEDDEEFYGKGNYVYIDLNSPSLTELKSGTYTFDAEYFINDEETRYPNTFVDADFLIDADFDTNEGDDFWTDENSSGTVTVNISGDTYEIIFSIVESEGEKIEGYYKGTLENITYEKSKNKKRRN